jgi:hypothetical protein
VLKRTARRGKRASNTFYLGFYLLLIISFKHQRCLTEGWLRTRSKQEIDAQPIFYLVFYLLLIISFKHQRCLTEGWLRTRSKQEIDVQLRSKTFSLIFGFASIYACFFAPTVQTIHKQAFLLSTFSA